MRIAFLFSLILALAYQPGTGLSDSLAVGTTASNCFIALCPAAIGGNDQPRDLQP